MQCKLCEKHIWSDHQFFHVCAETGKETDLEQEACRAFQFSKRGHYGCPEHVNVYNTEDIEGKVKDDRYTRKKKEKK